MGFPHSEISGSTFATNSPDLFAGNRVLHRPQAPRHSPCALCSLTYKSSIQPSPRRGRADAVDSPINTIGTNFAFGETRNLSSSSLVKVHHLLVRVRARSTRERARARTNQWKLFRICFALQRGEIPARTSHHTAKRPHFATSAAAVEPRRLELLTSSLQRRRSTS